jgi:hypothetical protein
MTWPKVKSFSSHHEDSHEQRCPCKPHTQRERRAVSTTVPLTCTTAEILPFLGWGKVQYMALALSHVTGVDHSSERCLCRLRNSPTLFLRIGNMHSILVPYFKFAFIPYIHWISGNRAAQCNTCNCVTAPSTSGIHRLLPKFRSTRTTRTVNTHHAGIMRL